ncbi:2-hydroxycarboxylate transporter family protein [Clostridium sp. AM58-1XD]|uniref:2-hydroxycarboxylate transporter family protein n=1 Tax=Clostridium sp. AM58-1XD TaxID=2292307 RepID=UPI000E530CD3|nr:2-hydroxycarboxylate transporter family protein [Clostridium sp. AM58-1XD]RGY98093.1 citrate-sodium symporter [Clostridium sp. AM58-1XD]
MKEKMKDFRIMGIPAVPYAIILAIVLVAMYTGNLGGDLLSTIVLLIAIGSILFEIGDRIPIFNKWVGGGSMMAMMFTSWMVYMNWIPEKYVESVSNFYDTFGFQTLFICFLMAGSLLVIERDSLIKSIVRYIPTILAGVAGAAALGLVVGMLLGHKPSELVCYYILPIMGGGNGAGAIPMSQIFNEVTGLDKDTYYAKAIAILTFANILCVFAAAFLNGAGRQFPKLTGDGTNLMRNKGKEAVTDKKMKLLLRRPGNADAVLPG